MSNKGKLVHIRIEDDLVERVDHLSGKIGLDRSKVIREILKKYFKYKEKPVL